MRPLNLALALIAVPSGEVVAAGNTEIAPNRPDYLPPEVRAPAARQAANGVCVAGH